MKGFGSDVVELHDPAAIWCAICNPPTLGEDTRGPKLASDWGTTKRIFQIERRVTRCFGHFGVLGSPVVQTWRVYSRDARGR